MNAPTPNIRPLAACAAEIGAFLRDYLTTDIHLVAIEPDGQPRGQSFGEDVDAAVSWALNWNARGWGLYWTVNRCRPGVNKKCEKDDITAVRFLHVDIDPPKSGAPWSIVDAQTALAGHRYPPRFVIASGGGVGAYWSVDDSLAADTAERINQGLCEAFGGDHCWNVDRVMRLPGTVNWPDKRKIARGRQPALATILEPDDGVTYPTAALVAEFQPVARDQKDRDRGTIVSPTAFALLTADDLRLTTLHPLRSLIDHPAGRDRSGDAYACAGRMVRDGYSDEQILGVLMNPVNAVHAHIGDHRDPRYAALRCIEGTRAKQAETVIASSGGNDYSPTLGSKADRGLFALIDPAAWHGHMVPSREWSVDGWVPLRQATLITGKGGVGKSLLAQMLATCVALGMPFMGQETRQAPALYLTAEDDADELWRRQRAICEALGVTLADLSGKLFLAALAGDQENPLATFDAEGRITPSPRWRAIQETVAAHEIGFIALDNASHMMIGDHSDLASVAAFLNMLNGLAVACNGAVLILHHPNKAGDDWLGSVAWENQVRSRLILKPSDTEGDPDARVLLNPKANYAPMGGRIDMRWFKGAFIRDEDMPPNIAGECAAISAANADNATFLTCLDERTRQGRAVSDKHSPTFAPTVFAQMPEGKRMTKARHAAAMDRLWRIGQIERAELWKGDDRKPVYGLRRVAGNGAVNTVRETRETPLEPAENRAGNAANTHTISKDIPGPATKAASPGLNGEPKRAAPIFTAEHPNGRPRGAPILAPGESEGDPVPGWE